MKSGTLPYRFDMRDLLARGRRLFGKHVGDVTLSLPFISFAVSPKSRENQVAREIVIRLRDRRVLSACECCDDCIDRALESLQEIRRLLVDKQVELSSLQDGALYLLLDSMALGIRQFLTYEETINAYAARSEHDRRDGSFYRPPEMRQLYFDALEMLRGHLSHCLTQVALIADVALPADHVIARYQGPWQIEAYPPPHDDDGRA